MYMIPVDLYLRARELEGRLYPDAMVARLPQMPAEYPLADEWQARATSSSRLVRYLEGNARPLKILDVGCGNGWLSHKLSLIPNSHVWGVDINERELGQAARIFNNDRLSFLKADVFQAPFSRRSFDAITLVSVIQYFPDLPGLLQVLKTLLSPVGEIHVLDSPLYEPDEVPSARERTRLYYTSLNLPEMAEHYFHHACSSLDQFFPRWLYKPGSLASRLTRRLGKAVSPFPWIVIR